MTTDLIQRNAQLSTFANLVYKDPPPAALDGWRRMETTPSTASGFYAVAYVNSNKEVVISMRGTDGLKDLVADGAFVFDAWNQQFSDAAKFVADVKLEMAREDISGSPVVTGHSLGGGIAQVVGKMFGLDGAAFDAPGAADIVGSPDFSRTALQYGQSNGNEIGPDFINYNSQGSLISAAGTQIGQSQSLVSLTDPSLAPLLIGSLGMLGSPILGLLGFAAVGNIVSTHPSGGIERAMWVTAALTKALDAGTIQMSTMSWTEATGGTWLYDGSPPQVPVFKDSEGKLLAVVAKEGDSLTISTPDQSTIVRIRTSVDKPVLACTVEKNGEPAMSCDISQQNSSSVDLNITAYDEGGAVAGTIDVVCDGEEWTSKVEGEVAVLANFIPAVWNRGGASDASFMDNDFFPTDEQLLQDLITDGELENPTPVITVKVYIDRVLAYDGDVGVNIRNFPAPISWGDEPLHRVTIFVAEELYVDEYHDRIVDAIHLGERAVASQQWNQSGQSYKWDTFSRPGWFDFVSNMTDNNSTSGTTLFSFDQLNTVKEQAPQSNSQSGITPIPFSVKVDTKIQVMDFTADGYFDYDAASLEAGTPLQSDSPPDVNIHNELISYTAVSGDSRNKPSPFDEYPDVFESPPMASEPTLPAMFAQASAAAGTEQVALSLVTAMAQFSAGVGGAELSIRATGNRDYNGMLLAAA